MKIERLEVKRFRRVRDVDLAFGRGLNVVYGPNDLGKSTLAEAVRAALLVRSTSKDAERFVPWDDPDGRPMVRLTFRDGEGIRWRVRKRFGSSGGTGALLERESEGELHEVAKGRQVDGMLRELLRWGVPPPGGRGGPRGVPDTFLARALLGAQGEAAALLDRGVDADPGSSGREWLEETVAAYARDEAFDDVLERARAQVAKAFQATGKRSSAAGSPFREAADRLHRRLEEERRARLALEEAVAAGEALETLRAELRRAEAAALDAGAQLRRAEAHAHSRRRAALDAAIAEAEKEVAEGEARAARARAATAEREAARARLAELSGEASALEKQLARARAATAAVELGAAEEARREARERHRSAMERSRHLEQARRLLEERALREALAQRRELAAEAEAVAATAGARDAEAKALDVAGGPDPDALAEADAAAQAYEVARARLTVGLRLRLELAADVEAEVTLDGGAPGAADGTLEADARARVILRRGETFLASLDARAGDEALHAEAERARAALEALLRPLLVAHEAGDRDELHERAREAADRRTQAAERRSEASRLRERATELRARSESAELETRLATLAESIDERAGAEALLDQGEPIEALAEAIERARVDAEAALAAAEERAVRAQATLTASRAALEDPDGELPAAADPAALSEALRAKRAAIAAATEAPTEEPSADEAHDRSTARDALAELRARRSALEEQAPPEVEDPGDDAPPPPEEATRLRDEAEAAVRSVRESIARLEGRAERLPIADAEARLERARAATERARVAEREVELEYGGYRRLVAVLEETASKRGRDLGAALIAPVQDRFAALLEAVGGEGRRYGGLALDADVAAEGAVVDGALRELAALSVGTREQLATLLRLTLAERLGSFLLLDDHLTHTDAERAQALGAVLRRVAEQTQVIVFTCHPDSYLAPDERAPAGGTHFEHDTVRAVDAAALLRG